MEFVHETVVKRSEVFQAVGAGFFQAFEKKYLRARIQLFKQMAELGHAVAAGRNAENVVNQTFDELLRNIFGAEVSVRQFACGEEFIKWNRLSREGTLLLRGSHAGGTSREMADLNHSDNFTGGVLSRQVRRRSSSTEPKD